MSSTVELHVMFAGDVVRREAFARELRETLAAEPSLRGAGLAVSSAPQAPPDPGSKGGVEAAVVLLVAGVPYARPVADALIASVDAWCARDRRTTVVARDGDRSVEITGEPSTQQKQLVDDFLWSRRDEAQ